MSADNWAICPNCVKLAQANKEKLEKKARDSYGKVSLEEYQVLVSLASTAVKDSESYRTLREDFDIGISEDGMFNVSYSGSCRACGFEYSYTEEDRALEHRIR